MRMTVNQVYGLMLQHAAAIAPRYSLDTVALAQWGLAVAWVESKFDPDARAPKPHTAKGLMQVNNITKVDAEKLLGYAPASEPMVFNPSYNVEMGLTILAYRIRRCGDVELGIIAYNQGNCGAKARVAAARYLSLWHEAMRLWKPVTEPLVGLIPAHPEWY